MKPMLFHCLKSYSLQQFWKDVIAGLIVAIIALPLSIALAIASGVSPERGIYTAVVAGFVISFLGGSTVQIAGPTAAFATIVAGIVSKNGMDGLIVATIIAGVFLLLMGIFKLGSLIKFIPFTITTGFTAGIAVTILLGQLKDFFGITYPEGMPTIETVEKVEALISGFGTFQWEAAVVGAVCLIVLIVMPKISSVIPGSLVAVLIGITMTQFIPAFANVATIGGQYADIPTGLPSFTFPKIDFNLIQNSVSDGFTIAILAAIESLLSCVVADGMVKSKHNSNMELIAQGAGNIASVLFGGIPATGAIARTAANIKNGGRTPIAGMIHAVVLLLVLLVLMPYAKLIPMPTIAAILIMVAYNMSHWRTFANAVKTAPKSDIAVLVVTFLLTVIFDLVVAIEIGMLLACVFFMKRMSEETVAIDDTAEQIEALSQIPDSIGVYEFTGPLFFGDADQIENVVIQDSVKILILRMRSVTAIDSTAMNALVELYARCEEKGVKMIMSHVNDQPMRAMKKARFDALIGEKNFCKTISHAIEYAYFLLNQIL